MDAEKINKLAGEIFEYIQSQYFIKYDLDMAEALSIVGSVSYQTIYSISVLLGSDLTLLIARHCDLLKQLAAAEEPGTSELDGFMKLLDKVRDELDGGIAIEQIVEKYFDCSTPALRQELITKLTVLAAVRAKNANLKK